MATTASTRRQFLSLLGLSAVAVSCGTTAGATSAKGQTKTLRYQGWAGQVTLPELAQDLGYLEDVKLEWVGNTISGPQDIQSAATGQIDFGGAFNGAVVKLAANKAPSRPSSATTAPTRTPTTASTSSRTAPSARPGT
jgi:ABC-type nitrate/sulfonate/bicarbonate transport system substrate-binding protein